VLKFQEKIRRLKLPHTSTYHGSVEDASSVYMKLQAMAFSNLANLVNVFYRQALATTTAAGTSKKIYRSET
jgi:hypothetical protein